MSCRNAALYGQIVALGGTSLPMLHITTLGLRVNLDHIDHILLRPLLKMAMISIGTLSDIPFIESLNIIMKPNSSHSSTSSEQAYYERYG